MLIDYDELFNMKRTCRFTWFVTNLLISLQLGQLKTSVTPVPTTQSTSGTTGATPVPKTQSTSGTTGVTPVPTTQSTAGTTGATPTSPLTTGSPVHAGLV